MPNPYFNKEEYIGETLRVNHAGEYGAKRIYEGQLRFTRDPKARELIKEMLAQEEKHLAYFKARLAERGVRPSLLSPLWNLGGYLMGAFSALAGPKSSMFLTQKVEEVIEGHYAEQLIYLEDWPEEKELKENIKKFMEEETEHKNLAIENDSDGALFRAPAGGLIKLICKTAIFLGKKI